MKIVLMNMDTDTWSITGIKNDVTVHREMTTTTTADSSKWYSSGILLKHMDHGDILRI